MVVIRLFLKMTGNIIDKGWQHGWYQDVPVCDVGREFAGVKLKAYSTCRLLAWSRCMVLIRLFVKMTRSIIDEDW